MKGISTPPLPLYFENFRSVSVDTATVASMALSAATIIAVMGVTGVGNSTFIKYATGAPEGILIGDGLESCKSSWLQIKLSEIPSY